MTSFDRNLSAIRTSIVELNNRVDSIINIISGNQGYTTTSGAAKFLGRSRPYIYSLVRKGLLRRTPSGLIPIADLVQFAETGIAAEDDGDEDD